MPPQTVSRQRAIELIGDLPDQALPKVITFLESLRPEMKQKDSQKVEESEAALLRIIRRTFPAEVQEQISYLRDRKEKGLLTDSECAELVAFLDRIERADTERAEALAQLAQLRGVPVKNLLRELA